MQRKAIFKSINTKPYVDTYYVTCDLPKGFALSQKQKGIKIVHDSYIRNFKGIEPLEISSKSTIDLGVKLSAFNLKNNEGKTVENKFQSSKTFEDGGPFVDLLDISPSKAKKDERLFNSGRLICFTYKNINYPLNPKTAFYDYIYLMALLDNQNILDELSSYIKDGASFTDIEFNPDRSINCQAKTIALYVGLKLAGIEINKNIKFEDFVKCAY